MDTKRSTNINLAKKKNRVRPDGLRESMSFILNVKLKNSCTYNISKTVINIMQITLKICKMMCVTIINIIFYYLFKFIFKNF